MSEGADGTATGTTEGTDELIAAYRHDIHKFTGDPHDTAPETVAGVPVNQPVPHGADSDAAALSRPSGQPEQTVDAHQTHVRLSLLTGQPHSAGERETGTPIGSAVRVLVIEDDPERLHQAWLDSDVAATVNESVYYPYTSLKYHTLLVAALLSNYRAGHAFSALALVVDPADEIVPHRTVYGDDDFALRIAPTDNLDDRPFARLGSRPWRSWAAAWPRLTAHPLDTDSDRWAMTLDANLRRIQSWSTALQYIEDVRTWGGRP